MELVDIVVPCFNEEEVLSVFIEETNKEIAKIPDYRFRYILVDDGSRDQTLRIMRKLAENQRNIKYISFSRNFGKEAALYAGMKASSGAYVIVMDADLQHPPSLFGPMLSSLRAGHDCCAAFRVNRRGDGFLRGGFSRLFFHLSNRMTKTKIPYGAVDYRIMTRQMVDAVCSLPEGQRFSKGLFNWVGFDTEWISYEDVQRTMGMTKWNFKGLLKYAVIGIISFSTSPLIYISVFGFIVSLLAFLYCLVTLVQTFLFGIDVPGYVSLLSVVLLLGGLTEFSVGILGIYISRIYNETKSRPIYLVKLTNMGDEHEDNSPV